MTLNRKKYEKKLKTILCRKGILLTNRPVDNELLIKRLTAKDIMYGIEENPRLLGPTIILLVQHQKIFDKMHLLPDGMVEVIENLRKGNKIGPNYKYEEYRKLYDLCSISQDGRVKGVNKKIRKNYRFDREIIKKLQELAKARGFKTETEALEFLINDRAMAEPN